MNAPPPRPSFRQYKELQSNYEQLQRRVAMYELEVARLKEELEAAGGEAKEANENSVNFWGESKTLAAQLKDSQRKCQVSNDHALEVIVENKSLGAEIERQAVEIQRQGAIIQQQSAEVEQKGVELQNLCAENVWLRARQRTEEDDRLFHRLVAICRRFTAYLLSSQGIEVGGIVFEVKSREDVEHMAEALEHALDDHAISNVVEVRQ